MEIIYKNLSEIKEYEKNAKKHPEEQIEQIKESIEEFGFNDPIAIDENNVIIEGNGRYKALKELYGESYKVPCIILNGLSEEQKKAYILVHNKLNMNTGFDFDMLTQELSGIIDFDMGNFGFSNFEINFLKHDEEDDEETYEPQFSDTVTSGNNTVDKKPEEYDKELLDKYGDYGGKELKHGRIIINYNDGDERKAISKNEGTVALSE